MIKKKIFGRNKIEQNKLTKLVKKRGFSIGNQYSNNRNVFLHIMGKRGIDEHKDNDVVKLYINCDRKNISLLTGIIFDGICNIAGDKLQMKCVSEQLFGNDEQLENSKKIKNYQRNDKIVIYAENDSKSEMIAEKIKQLRLQYPYLFSENKTMPLLPKKYGFIGYGKEHPYNHAKTPVGVAAGKTYNEYMSDILFQSLVSGFDYNRSGASNEHSIDVEKRMSEYVKIYSEMLPEQRNAILGKSKEVFLQVCRDNRVNTIYTPVLEQELGGNEL